ncbi:MAG TPA: hypothetical protein VIM98_01260 [Dyella sp.]|uniref:hypothetical protein n=1 Tax=Dyella sp. TaxID=1869338 RepID=UPI002F957F2B
MKRILAVAISMGLAVASLGAQAQQGSLEEQLRSQLRDTRGQLQDLQGQQAQWQSQKAALEQERDQAKKALEQAQAELAKARGASPALAAEKAGRQKAEEETRQAQSAYAQVAGQAKQQESRNAALNTQLAGTQKQIEACSAKNEQLYKVGQEILDAYVHMDMGTLMSSRQPFATSARVKLDNAAQAYGDRMYEQRYVPAKQP